MKKFMIFFAVLAMIFFVSCGGDSKDDDKTDTGDTTPDTGDTEPTDTGDTNQEPTDPTTEPTNPTDPTEQEEGNWEAKYKKADDEASVVSKDVVKANNDLGMKMFSKLAAAEKGKNMMISPLSISIAMAMSTNGATDENLEEMKEVLGFGEMELGDVNEQFKHLIASLAAADKDLVLEIANSVWMREDFSLDVKAAFTDVLKDFYDAEVFAEGFTAENINAWVSEKTHGKIEEIVKEIGANTVMYLINALYFKAAWSTAFNEENTREGVFTLSDGTETKADFMSFSEAEEAPEFFSFSSDWGDNDGYAVVRIPYGRGVFAFYGIVPNYDNQTNVDDFIAKIAEKGFDYYVSELTEKEFPLELPKFKFEYSKSLVDIFKELGMEKAFVEGGFYNIAEAPHDPFISDILHKTFIEVNESGTEAAAVTAVEYGEKAMPGGFYANRPFVFVIRDDRTGSILFIGKVENPKAE
ncbi:serpin family protein [bacterium]|nr:serpin family protein [bacterium]